MHYENESHIKGGECYTMQTEYRKAKGERMNRKRFTQYFLQKLNSELALEEEKRKLTEFK